MKKSIWLLLAAVIFIVAACKGSTEVETKKVNLGIQQTLSPLWVAKEKGWLDEAFKEIGVEVAWTEFQSGPPQFEGIAAGKLDITEVGNTPPISGQAAGIDFKEIALLSKGLRSNAILVSKDSDIQNIRDLVGKKVAVAKGSSAFGLLYFALENEGVDPSKVEIIQLQPDEAQPAFENGTLDAWATWEPFISNQVVGSEARVLVNGEDVHAPSPMLTIARTDLLEENPQFIETYLEVYSKASKWVKDHPKEAVQFYADLKSLEPQVVESVLANTPYELQVISDEYITEQQRSADLLYRLQVINKEIDTADVVENKFIEVILEGTE